MLLLFFKTGDNFEIVLKSQGRLFFYYSPQMPGNNFSILGTNSKFWGGGGKKKEKEIQRKYEKSR